MKVGIIGGGVVGRATARCFMEHAEVRVHDVCSEKATHSYTETLRSDLVFVCLPTPQHVGTFECDTSAIDSFFENVAEDPFREQWQKTGFILRSTVPIGTTRRIRDTYNIDNIVHSPEFLTARCAITDAQIPARNIIGVPNKPRDGLATGGNRAGEMLNILYHQRFSGVPVYLMSSDESEAVKLFLNGFFAVKVAYWNEVRTLADQLQLDWQRVMEGVLSDGRIAHSHTQVPGPDGKFGFGGTCLPKDLASLVHHLMTTLPNFGGPLVTTAALARNTVDREREP